MTFTPVPDRVTAPRSPSEPEPIALRIVVDGASTAGKTTTARALGDRLGRPVVTPEELAGRTLLFDWMDHIGGRSDGRPIRTQVVAVPGHLPHLRARLLVTADVVLFVADTSAPGMPETRAALAQVNELLQAMPEPRPGLLVQANKRDHPEALPLDEVRRQLGLDEDELVIETVATEGEGVRQSFVYAVRLGLRHIRAVGGPRVAERQLSADDLLAELDTDPRTTEELAADRARTLDADTSDLPATADVADAAGSPSMPVAPGAPVAADALGHAPTDDGPTDAAEPALGEPTEALPDPEPGPEAEPEAEADPEPEAEAEQVTTPTAPATPERASVWAWPAGGSGRRPTIPPPWRRWLDRD